MHYLLPLPYHFVVIVRQCPEGTTPISNSAETHNAPDTQLSHTARTHRCTQQVQASSQDSQDSREVQDSIKTRTSFIDSARAPSSESSHVVPRTSRLVSFNFWGTRRGDRWGRYNYYLRYIWCTTATHRQGQTRTRTTVGAQSPGRSPKASHGAASPSFQCGATHRRPVERTLMPRAPSNREKGGRGRARLRFAKRSPRRPPCVRG